MVDCERNRRDFEKSNILHCRQRPKYSVARVWNEIGIHFHDSRNQIVKKIQIHRIVKYLLSFVARSVVENQLVRHSTLDAGCVLLLCIFNGVHLYICMCLLFDFHSTIVILRLFTFLKFCDLFRMSDSVSKFIERTIKPPKKKKENTNNNLCTWNKMKCSKYSEKPSKPFTIHRKIQNDNVEHFFRGFLGFFGQ